MLMLVTRNFPPARGGIETLAWELAVHGAREGVPVAVVHIGQGKCPSPPRGVSAYHHFRAANKWTAFAVSTLAIPWLALRHRPRAIVHLQVTTTLGGWLARRLLGIPYVVVCTGMEMLPGLPGWYRRLRGPALRGARRVVSISRYTDSLAAGFGVPASRRQVINPGTRPCSGPGRGRSRADVFGPEAEERFLCLSISRLVPRKGMDVMLEALAQVVRARRDVLYCIGGDGPDLGRLRALAAEKGVTEHVRFLGEVADADLGACYALADLFVLPARESQSPPDAEGFGLVFLEAAACGTPSLGGRSGGVPDAIRDGETGFLVEPTQARELALKILQLMEDRGLLGRLAEAARAQALESSWEKACARYYAAFLA